jgi:hypothetical protein
MLRPKFVIAERTIYSILRGWNRAHVPSGRAVHQKALGG